MTMEAKIYKILAHVFPLVFGLLLLVVESDQKRRHDRWDQVSVRYGLWYDLPPYQSTAFEQGYNRLNDVCKTDHYHGFLFQKGSNTKAMPIYDLNGNLAGIRAAIPGNMQGFNSQNETIDLPPVEIMPPVLKGLRDARGMLYYTVTAYFKHPKLICSPIASKGVSPGRGLFIQMGYNPENYFLEIPKEDRQLSQLWRRGNCVPMMGTHYFMNMSEHLPCEKIYPVFLMYDMEGNLGAFGWVFQGRPDNFYSEDGMGWFHITPQTYPFLYDTKQLPPCMLNDQFQVFGIHIYLQEPTKLLCRPIVKDKTEHPTTLQVPVHTKRPPPRTLITVIENEKRLKSDSYAYDTDTSSSSKIVSTYSTIFCSLFIVMSVMFCS